MRFDLSKIQSSKTRNILTEAIGAIQAIEDAGLHREAAAVKRLVRSRILANATNSSLAADLRKAVQSE